MAVTYSYIQLHALKVTRIVVPVAVTYSYIQIPRNPLSGGRVGCICIGIVMAVTYSYIQLHTVTRIVGYTHCSTCGSYIQLHTVTYRYPATSSVAAGSASRICIGIRIIITNSFATDFVGRCSGLGPVLIAN
jgi:hypothetical protein